MSIRVLIQMRDLRVGNGIAACIMNYYEYTAKQGYQIDFLLNRNIESPYVEVVKRYGSSIHTLPCDTNKPNKKNWKFIKSIVNKEYDIIHVNLSGINGLEALLAARMNGIDRRIYHAHNPKDTSSVKARFRSLIYENASVWLANQYAACSSYAGDSKFNNKKYTIVKNPVNTQLFVYDEAARKRLRKELEIEDCFVIGVVGRLEKQKNPFFVIDIFAEVKKHRVDARLIWAGEGDLREPLERYIRDKGLTSSIQLLGVRKDVNLLYSAMDAFLLPSKFEGFGLAFVEAQISGLPCFGSDKVPSDVQVSSNMYRISLERSASDWCNEVLQKCGSERPGRNVFVNTGFEIDALADSLVQLYRQ